MTPAPPRRFNLVAPARRAAHAARMTRHRARLRDGRLPCNCGLCVLDGAVIDALIAAGELREQDLGEKRAVFAALTRWAHRHAQKK
jgi:hypothetical protein